MRHNRVRVNKNNDKYHQSPHVGGIFVVVAIIASLLIPVLAVAEGEGTPEATSIEVQPTAVPTLPPPPPTAIPTQPPPPPTAVPTLPPPPPTAVPTVPPAPTAIPPTQAPAPAPAKVAPQPVVSKPEPTATVAPTATLEPSPTPSPTAVPSPTPSPTAIVWTNTDVLTIVDRSASSSLEPGARATVTIRYNVTTPRASTVIHAELTGDVQGWTLSSPALADADAAAAKAVWAQAGAVAPGTSFDLPIVVTAPANVTADQTVSLHLWSVADTDHGQETGVAKVAQPYAQFTVIAPPPPTAVPTPTTVPVTEPEDDVESPGDDPTAEDGKDLQGEDSAPASTPIPSASPDSRPELPSREEANESGEGEPVGTGGVEVAASPQASPVAEPEGSEGEAGEEHDIDPVASPMASPVAEPQVSGAASRMLPGASGSNTCTPSDGSHMDPDTRIASFTCEFSKGPLVIEWVSQELSPGWKVNVDGQGFSDSPPEGKIGNGSDQEFSMQLRAPQEFVCDAESSAGSVSFRAYVNPKKAGDSPLIKTTLSAMCPTATIAVPPTVSVEPFSFESLTWNGKEWGTTQGTANIEIHRDDPGERGVYDVQVQVTKTVYGLAPRVSSSSVVSENREGLSARMIRSDSDDDVPVTVAQVGPSFTGDGQVDVEYTLTPENDVPAGEHSMTIRVTVSNGD